jgi:hypothetical protein
MIEKTMNFEEAVKVADAAVLASEGRHITDVEMAILRGSWENQTYEEMAEMTEYAANYLQRTVGHKFWKTLSKALGEEVSKTNFRTALERKWRYAQNQRPGRLRPGAGTQPQRTKVQAAAKLEFPEGPVAVDSPFYVGRTPIESECYEAILQAGALICIKSPKQMGKTSLLYRILERAKKQGYQTVRLNLLQAEKAVFSNLDKFLRWFCSYVSQKLDIPAQLNDYWDEDRGSILSCTTYFEAHILEQIDSPLVLALDEVDRVFQYPEIAEEFLPMLRSWHEEAKNREIWEKLRLVVVHSTEYYGKLDIHQSPFNVGLPVKLTDFTLEQVENLARRHGLDGAALVGEKGFSPLLEMVGGHPYLVRLALYHLADGSVTLLQLLQDAPTDAGIYSEHLRRHLVTLKEHPELAGALKQVVTSTESVRLETIQAYKLDGMGLIKRQGNQSSPRCELYRQYFWERLGDAG